MLLRLWRTWRARVRLFRAVKWSISPHFLNPALHYPECARGKANSSKEYQPYEALAPLWHGYTGSNGVDYPAFLDRLAKAHGLKLHSVLEIACGTGHTTSRLADIAQEVVGLDVSEPMLAVARSKSSELPGVQYVQGDFRDFQLGRSFDAVVCGFNSLNYAADRTELRAVFQRVAEHLKPGGLFAFDTVTHFGMSTLSGWYLHVPGETARFAMHFNYDPGRRVETVELLLRSRFEIHRRVPIDPDDVKAAVEGTGLVLDSYFSSRVFPGWLYTGAFCFFVLRKLRVG